jgi:CRISP-associated protein Cas1
VEAQAARRYWQALMGPDFRRDQDGGGTNGLLNYGYTVLRAIVSRAICAAGLHPSIGLPHSNRSNAFALADDLMEPYRPIVDRAVYNLVQDGIAQVSPEAKTALAALTALDLPALHGMSPLHVHATRLAQQLAALFARESGGFDLPLPVDPLTLAGLARQSVPS